jgi:uncharacterized protein (TIGR03067 family)
MVRRPLLVGACLVGWAVWYASFAQAEESVERANELKALRGTWEVESLISDGNEEESMFLLEIADEQMSLVIGDNKISFQLTIDPTCTPKLIDLAYDANQDQELQPEEKLEGIYELAEGKLRICLTPPQGVRERPQKFESPAGSGRVLATLRRR